MLEKYDFDDDVQDDILYLMATDSMFLSEATRTVDPVYFARQERRKFARLLIDFQDKYALPPTKGQINSIVTQEIRRGLSDGEDVESLGELLRRIYSGERQMSSRGFTLDMISTFAKHRALEQATYAALPLIDAGKYEEADELFAKARVVGQSSGDAVYWFFESAQERIRRRGTEDDNWGIPTGIIEVDSLIRRGHMGPGEVCVWLAPKGGGKSLAMCQMARRAIFGGFKVIYFSFEMSASQLADRQDSGFSGVSSWDLEQEKDVLHDVFSDLSIRFPKALAIKNFPTKQFTIDGCDQVLENLWQREGWKPDMIVLDYLSIVKPKRHQEKHLEIQEIAEDFRGLCSKWEAVGHTANQINRSGAEKEIATGADASGSWDQLASVDYVFTINRSEADRIAQTLTLFADKVRDGLDKIKIEGLLTDWERMVFCKRSNKTLFDINEERRRRRAQSAHHPEPPRGKKTYN